MDTDVSGVDAQRLRTEYYNASVVSVQPCHDELMVMRIRPDQGIPSFLPGQYTVLGLGYWEDRLANCQPEGELGPLASKLIKRAFSISCPIFDDQGNVVAADELDFLEFFVALVRRSDQRAPALSPRIFALDEGDRIFCGPHVHGNYTLASIQQDENVVFVATGTGEAPHNAMTVHLLKSGHCGRIVNVACTRWKKDLAYRAAHRRLEQLFPSYRYLTLTTREPENLDESHPNYLGKQYLQDYFESGNFQTDSGLTLDPKNTHVFLCGNPAMIGLPLHTQGAACASSRRKGMVEMLENVGFEVDRPRARGNIHFERYW